MKIYYYLNANKEQIGPFTREELLLYINQDTMVWRQGMATWVKAGQMPELGIATSGTKNNSPFMWVSLGLVAILVGIITAFLCGAFDSKPQQPQQVIIAPPPTTTTTTTTTTEAEEPASKPETQSRPFEFVSMPSGSNLGSELAYMAASSNGFAGTHYGMTVADFSGVGGTRSGRQIKFNNDGYLIQCFFDGNVSHSSAKITGVAVSCECADEYAVCADFENTLGSISGVHPVGSAFENSIGSYFSGGYKNSRFYIYYYYENATDKGLAPRN